MSSLTKKQTGVTFGVFFMICAVYFVIPDMGYIIPSLPAIAEQYGVDTGVASYLSTGVSLAQIVGALVCGQIVGRIVKAKHMLMIATGFMAVFGVLPAVLPEGTPFAALMIDRLVFGFFLGFLQPIIFAYIAQIFVDENKRASGYGIGNIAFNVGAVFATSIGGVMVAIAWNAAFWLYAVGIVVLLIVAIFWKDPDLGNDAPAQEEKKGEKTKITGTGWIFISLFAIVMLFDYPFMTALTSCLITHGVCDAVIGGQLQSLFTIVGIVVSAIFGFVFRKLKFYVLPVCFFIVAIAHFLLFTSVGIVESLVFVIVCVCIFGIGHATLNVAIPQCVSVACTPAVASAALAFTAMSMNIGGFISSPYMQLVAAVAGTTDYTIVFLVSGCAMLVLGFVILAFVRNVTKRVKAAQVEED